MNKDTAPFEAWWAEVARLDPGTLHEHELLPAPEGFADVWRAIYAGGFTPEEATAEARITAWLEKLDAPPAPTLRLVTE